jgi:hypothetical protein
VLHVQEGLRKKGIFGSRFGELYITNRRVAFVKAIMKAGIISAAIKSLGAKPIIELERASVRAEKVAHKKLFALVVSNGDKSERFLIEPHAIDPILALLAPSESHAEVPGR